MHSRPFFLSPHLKLSDHGKSYLDCDTKLKFWQTQVSSPEKCDTLIFFLNLMIKKSKVWRSTQMSSPSLLSCVASLLCKYHSLEAQIHPKYKKGLSNFPTTNKHPCWNRKKTNLYFLVNFLFWRLLHVYQKSKRIFFANIKKLFRQNNLQWIPNIGLLVVKALECSYRWWIISLDNCLKSLLWLLIATICIIFVIHHLLFICNTQTHLR